MSTFWEIVASNALIVSILAAGVGLLGRFWKNPAGMHLLWLLVILKLITPPVVTVSLPFLAGKSSPASEERRTNVPRAYASPVDNSPRQTTASTTVIQDDQHFADNRPISEPIPNREVIPFVLQHQKLFWLTILRWIWGTGIILLAAYQAYRIFRFTRLLRYNKAPSTAVLEMVERIAKRLGLKMAPPIRMLPIRVSPLVWSLGGRPKLLLPMELFAQLDGAAQEAILAHELAHVRRKDHWVRLLELAVTTLFWWHPVVWWAARRLQELEDQCCDGMVVDMSPHSAKSYATALLDTLDFLSERAISAPLGATAAKYSHSLTRRITMLKNRTPELRLSLRRLVLLATVAALPMAVAFGQKTSVPTDNPPQNSPSTGAPAESADKKAEQGLTYRGTVVDKSTGKPVEGATVLVRLSIYSSTEDRKLQETEHVTDVQGNYSFHLSPEQVSEKYMYIEVEASHPRYARHSPEGYALSMIRKNEKLGERPFFERFELQPGEEISGALVTPDNQPAANVKILTYSKADKNNMADYGSFAKTTTDAQGKFRLNVVKGGEAILWLLPRQYAPSTHLLHQQRGDLGRFALEKGITLQGKVLDHMGQPVHDVWINAELHGGPAKKQIEMPVSDAMARSALTNADGDFTMDPLPAGDYTLLIDENARASDTEDHTRRPVDEVFLHQKMTLKPDEPVQTVQIKAVPYINVEIHQVNSAGKPKKTHAVHFYGHSGDTSIWSEGRPDANGKIVLKVPIGLEETTIEIMTNEHGTARWRADDWKEGKLENRDDMKFWNLREDLHLTIYYYDAPTLLVKAIAEDGTAISDFKPQIIYPSDKKTEEKAPHWLNGLQGDVHFKKQDDGRWRSTSLLPDEPFLLIVEADGYKPWCDRFTLPEKDVKELEVQLQKR